MPPPSTTFQLYTDKTKSLIKGAATNAKWDHKLCVMCKEKKKITKPHIFGGLFFLTIVVFAAIYAIFSSTIVGVSNILDALYFSIVTITTLGFGDIVPAGTAGRVLVCVEAVAGVVFIGLFLNAISESQAHKVDENEKKRTKKERKDNARAKLRQYYIFLKSIMERYLIEAYAVTTPINKRMFPEDILHHKFQFSFNDMSDLYKASLLLYDPPYKPVIAIFFELQDKLYAELRRMVSDVDISYWPQLEAYVHSFLKECNDFGFKGSILSFAHTTQNNEMEFLSNLIKEHEGDLHMLPSNAINQFIALYDMLKANIELVQQMVDEMKKNSEIELHQQDL